jgi:hypothetical protein
MTKCHTFIDGYVAETATSIIVYRLPTKENKLPFSVSVAANKRKLPFRMKRPVDLP